MRPKQEIEQLRQTIKTLESMEESTTESFRIVILTLKLRETALQKEVARN